MVVLEAEQSLVLTPRQVARIDCLSGVVWVTRSGDALDHFVAAGGSVDVGPGLTIATALEHSVLRVTAAHRRPLRAALARLLGRYRARHTPPPLSARDASA